ncbi:IclR family transcriptional regulator [Mycolicibacterium murale]|uniref:IclR family transcriptional regulator n=1 Tax=Mycolicibacterium murale TaxID=182220 RepID=A0A7I9WEZ3_9MYCO|nr:IclR family transcriptional regulator [Mycolicibacterium murale]MCV7182243.1 IclR family transcriptional regulator [Mycolicibacterium murale]GFG56069.1 IclR family transcriptional regulator [Mycolicibacterium murale]
MTEQRVAAVERALAILNAFHEGDRGVTLAILAKRTGLYRSTILRLCASLERYGFLYRDHEGAFHLGAALWRLGNIYQGSFDIASYVRPVLSALVESTGETSAFYIREGDRRICLFREHAPRPFRHHIEEGSELPLDRGASARILLAYGDDDSDVSQQVRAEGFYYSRGERDPDASAIAVPVFGTGQRFVGSLGVTFLTQSFTEAKYENILEALRRESASLSAQLGYCPSTAEP